MAFDPILQDVVDERINEALKSRVFSLDNLPMAQLSTKLEQLILPLQPEALPNGLWSPGDMKMLGGTTPDPGWLLCDGAAYSRQTYIRLFNKIGTLHGVGDGSTTFNVPDLKSRSPLGAGTGAGLTARAVGAKGGGEAPTMPAHSTGNDTPDHSHNVVPVYFHGGGTAGSIQNAGTGAFPLDDGTVTSQGANQRHTHSVGAVGSATEGNLHPFTTVTFAIYAGV